ncbi:MAG: SET domain-containing protein-lysine N-methyltransferase [Candidatus Moraniibacteriota bacterium]
MVKIGSKKPNTPFSWLSDRVVIRSTKKYGDGVFAVENIEKDEIIAIFGGHILTIDEEEELPEEFRDTGLQISENFVITGGKVKEDTDCFNHSCDPNAGFKGQIFLVAIKNIQKGEQVTFDYAMVLHSAKGAMTYKLKCLCGSEKCRGFTTEDDWKIPELQEKYAGYFQYFLQEKINKLKK